MRLTILLAAAVATSWVFGQVPGAMNYQGRLTTAAGQPVPDGNVRLIVRIYGSLTGNDLVWRSAMAQVPVRGGVFALQLGPGFSDEGQQNALNLGPSVFDGRFTFLEVQPEGQAALAPRTPILATPWAFVAGTVADGAITTSKLENGSVTAAKIAPGAVGSNQLAEDFASFAKMSFGRLLVGTGSMVFQSTADARLQVIGNAGSTADLYLDGPGQNRFKVEARSDGTLLRSGAALPIRLGAADRLNDLVISATGRVGIGTASPGQALHIAGNEADLRLRMANGSGRTYDLISTGSGSGYGPGYLRFWAESAQRDDILVTPAGNVGIGNILPQSRLDVNGNATIRGSVTATSEVAATTVRATHVVNFGTLYLNPFAGNGAVIVGGVGGTSQLGVGGDPVGGNLVSVHGNATKRDGGTSWSSWSDARLKHDVRAIQSPLDKLLALKGRTYRWSEEMDMATHNPGEQMGFVAQEVERVFPQWVSVGPNGYKLLNPVGVEALLVEGVRAQQTQIDELRKANATMRRENDDLKHRVATLESRLASLERRVR